MSDIKTFSDAYQDTWNWFKEAIPEPTEQNISTQTGVHLEEVGEMLEAITSTDSIVTSALRMQTMAINSVSKSFKMAPVVQLKEEDRVEFLDSLADQFVTLVGLAYMHKLDLLGAIKEVNRSNYSKFDANGKAILDANKKIIKSSSYSKPELEEFTTLPVETPIEDIKEENNVGFDTTDGNPPVGDCSPVGELGQRGTTAYSSPEPDTGSGLGTEVDGGASGSSGGAEQADPEGTGSKEG